MKPGSLEMTGDLGLGKGEAPVSGAAPRKRAGRTRALLVGFWLSMAVVQVLGFRGLRSDDAYISYRYGINLATGNGMVFNRGERVMGSTSPGQALLACMAYWVVGKDNLPGAMAAIGCLAWTAQAIAWQVLLVPLLGAMAAFLVALVVAMGAAGSHVYVPFEVNLVAAAVLWSLAGARAGRWKLAAALAATAGLFRADAFIFALLLAIAWIFRRCPGGRKVPLVFLAFALPWPLLACSYFGTVLPQSALRKFQQLPFAEYVRHEIADLGGVALPHLPAPASGCFVLALALTGGWLLARRQRLFWVLPAHAVLHSAAYSYLRPFAMHTWHLYLPVMIALVLALSLVGLAPVVVKLAKPVERRSRFFVSAVLAASAALYGIRCFEGSRDLDRAYWMGARDAVYRQVAAYLRENAGRGDAVAAVEVGTIGFYSGLRMYDWGGLVTPDKKDVPRLPSLRWVVVDPKYRFFLDQLPFRLVKVFRKGRFRVELYSVTPPASDTGEAFPLP